MQKLSGELPVPRHATGWAPLEKDGVLDPGVDAVAGVDAGVLPAPALGGGGQAGDPQLVAVAVLVLEQAEFGAGVRALAAGEDPHRRGPVLQLVPVRAFTQQPGQLGDVRFLDPAAAVPAAGARAGAVGAALADLAAVIDGDLPRLPGDQPMAAFSRASSSHPHE